MPEPCPPPLARERLPQQDVQSAEVARAPRRARPPTQGPGPTASGCQPADRSVAARPSGPRATGPRFGEQEQTEWEGASGAISGLWLRSEQESFLVGSGQAIVGGTPTSCMGWTRWARSPWVRSGKR